MSDWTESWTNGASVPLSSQDLDVLKAELAGLHAGFVFARLETLHDALAAQRIFPGRSRLRHLDRVLHVPGYPDFLAPFETHFYGSRR